MIPLLHPLAHLAITAVACAIAVRRVCRVNP